MFMFSVIWTNKYIIFQAIIQLNYLKKYFFNHTDSKPMNGKICFSFFCNYFYEKQLNWRATVCLKISTVEMVYEAINIQKQNNDILM